MGKISAVVGILAFIVTIFGFTFKDFISSCLSSISETVVGNIDDRDSSNNHSNENSINIERKNGKVWVENMNIYSEQSDNSSYYEFADSCTANTAENFTHNLVLFTDVLNQEKGKGQTL